MIKSQRFTAYRQNKGKNIALDAIFSELTWLRNRMNDYIYDNLYCLITDKHILLKQYAQFTSDIIPAWNIQKEFHFLSSLYENSIKRRISNTSLKIQKGMKICRYKKATRRHKPGDIKDFKLIKKSTRLCKFIKYLIYLNPSKIKYVKNDWFQEALEYYRHKPYFGRILDLAQGIRDRAISSVKKLNFTGEAALRTHKNHSKILYDPENAEYKWWFWLKLKNGFNIYLPLQFNDSYHTPERLISKEFLIFRKDNKKKVNIVTTCNVDDPQFISGMYRAEGLDINLKHNFASCSDGTEFDFDREFVKEQARLLKQLDEIGYQNLTERQLKNLRKIHRRLKGYFDYLCSNIMRTLRDKGITDLVVEDLLLKDKFGFSKEFGVKWHRLTKLLHLSNVKNALIRLGEKLGIRVHVSQSSYSSQQCPKCGCIDRKNRLTQEKFKCISCGHIDNADHNASINLKLRLLLDVLRDTLHTTDRWNRLRPKKLSRSKLKTLLEEFVSPCSLPINEFS